MIRLDHHNFINKADIKYMGPGRIFTFYNKLLNFGHQYGLYLLPLTELRYEQSLCPKEINGHQFNPTEYRLMAATLLEKLTRSDVIPDEYTKERNIVERHIKKNDGYLALYDLLEPHHGLLQKRIKMKAPDSADFGSDIHEYTAQFEAFLTSEELQGRYYDEEAQVVTYLQGLDDTFESAIHHINNIMDSWGQHGLNPKCELTKLPTTIETYMSRNKSSSHSFAVMRTIQQPITINDSLNDKDTNNGLSTDIICHQTKGAPPRKPSTTLESRRPIDLFCDACGGHGHPWKRCDYLAKLIKAAEFMKAMDKPKQNELLQSYHKEQQRLRENKIQRNLAKARTLKSPYQDAE
jgi:hypothetical protein